MSAPGFLGTTEPTGWQGAALVPLLEGEGTAPDPVALSTWHLALASTTALEVPHDLFALWLFPASGGVVLLGPEELAPDEVEVPLPAPQLLQDDLYQLEEVLRKARYSSAIAVPIRQDTRDVGVMLLGSFVRGAFGPTQAVALYRLAGQLAHSVAQLADAMPAVAPHAALEPRMTREQLPEHLARAACEAASGPDLIRRVSGILYALLPHDRLEILVPGANESAFSALSGNLPRRRWSTGSGAVEPYAGMVARFRENKTVLVDDLTEASQGDWSVSGPAAAARPARSLLGARLEVGGKLEGFLLLGSVARDAYRPDDEDTLALAGLILAPRVAALGVRGAGAPAVAPEAGRELPLARAAMALAGTAHLGEGLAAFATELQRVIPHEGISLHLRRGEDEVIALDPAAPRPLADLPALPLGEFEGAAILLGEERWLVRELDDREEVLVPLGVAGRVVGALGVRGRNFTSIRNAAAVARQFADVLAPHLELLRRGTVLGPSASRRMNPVETD